MLFILAMSQETMGTKTLFTKFGALCTFLILFSTQVIGQQSYADFHHEEDITKKAEIGYYLWNEYLRNDLDSLKVMSVELLLSAAEEKSTFARAIGNSGLGSYLIRNGEIEVGIRHIEESKKYFEQKEDYTILSENYNELGNAHYLAGEYEKAIKSYLASLRYGGLSPDLTAAFSGKLGLGRSYCAIGDTAVGLFTVEKYKDESIKHMKFESAADAYAFMGMIEMDRGNMDLSREYYEKSIVFSGKSKSKSHLSHAYNNKAILHFNLGEADSSLMYFEKSLRLRERIGHHKGIIESNYNVGFFHLEMGDFHNAYIHFNKSAKLARERNFRGDESDALQELLGICNELDYISESERIEKRLDELTTYLENKKSEDQEIIAYAQKVIKEAEMSDEEEVVEEGSSLYMWIIGIVVVIVGFFLFRMKR